MRSQNISNLFFGLVLIFIGVVFLLGNFVEGFYINWSLLWPTFILVPGLFFWVMWLSSDDRQNNSGLLVAANILIFLALTFYFNMFVTQVLDYGTIWAWTFFMYPGSIFLALFIAWLGSGSRKQEFRIGAIVFGIITMILFALMSCIMFFVMLFNEDTGKIFWPLLFIGLGIVLLLSTIVRAATKPEKKWFGKSEKEWEEWGEGFGRQMEKLGESIGNSINNATNGKNKA